MTKEPEKTDEKKIAPVPKLLVDRSDDFRFHAAYLIYSDAWDKNTLEEVRLKLNEILEALSKNEIDYESFYRRISQYRVEFNPEHFRSGDFRPRIETQRKKDWRKREERSRRNERHGR